MRRETKHILQNFFEDSQLGRAFDIGIAIALPRANERHNGEISKSQLNGVNKMESAELSQQNGVSRMESAEWSQQNGVSRMESAEWSQQNGVDKMESTDGVDKKRKPKGTPRLREGGWAERTKGWQEPPNLALRPQGALPILGVCLPFGRWV